MLSWKDAKPARAEKHVAYDELAENCDEEKPAKEGRFELVEKLEAMAPEEGFAILAERTVPLYPL